MSTPQGLLGIWKSLVEDAAHGGIVQRRVLPDSGHDCFLLLHQESGRRALRLIAHDQQNIPDAPPLSAEGFKVERAVTGRTVDVTVALTDASLLDPFLSLVEDLVEVARMAGQERTAATVLSRISAWMAFFESTGTGMGREAAAGLFAELTVLRSLVTAIGADAAVESWTGPEKSRQDFVFSNAAIEVKSWRGTGPASPTITSEHQLDTSGTGALRLAILTLDQRASGPGQQIADVIAALHRTLAASPAAVISFNTKLVEYGWAGSVPDHRTEVYTVQKREDFGVAPGFPCLIPDFLPGGVSHVSYRIHRSSLEPFLIQDPDVGKWLNQ
jgi:hypothetical protein